MYIHDYIPRQDAAMLAWSRNFVTIVVQERETWEISGEEIVVIEDALTEFIDTFNQARNPSAGRVDMERKTEARQRLEKHIRTMVNFRLRNPLITDADRVRLGLRVRDKNPSPIPPPVTRPEFVIEVADIRELSIVFHDQASARKARPYGTMGAVVAWQVSQTAPACPDDLTRSQLATRTPHLLQFTEQERGKTVHIALCWQNKKGQRGHWSEIQSAIIP